MNEKLAQASKYLDEALIAYSGRDSEKAYHCIHQAAVILEQLTYAQIAAVTVISKAA